MINVEIKDIEMIAKKRNVPVYVIIDEIVEKEMKKKVVENLVKRKK
jgi:predicted DNA-binding ribbon-helix-helix protein